MTVTKDRAQWLVWHRRQQLVWNNANTDWWEANTPAPADWHMAAKGYGHYDYHVRAYYCHKRDYHITCINLITGYKS